MHVQCEAEVSGFFSCNALFDEGHELLLVPFRRIGKMIPEYRAQTGVDGILAWFADIELADMKIVAAFYGLFNFISANIAIQSFHALLLISIGV